MEITFDKSNETVEKTSLTFRFCLFFFFKQNRIYFEYRFFVAVYVIPV